MKDSPTAPGSPERRKRVSISKTTPVKAAVIKSHTDHDTPSRIRHLGRIKLRPDDEISKSSTTKLGDSDEPMVAKRYDPEKILRDERIARERAALAAAELAASGDPTFHRHAVAAFGQLPVGDRERLVEDSSSLATKLDEIASYGNFDKISKKLYKLADGVKDKRFAKRMCKAADIADKAGHSDSDRKFHELDKRLEEDLGHLADEAENIALGAKSVYKELASKLAEGAASLSPDSFAFKPSGGKKKSCSPTRLKGELYICRR